MEKRKLRRLRTEVENIYQSKQIEITTTTKRIECRKYILELIDTLENRNSINVQPHKTIPPSTFVNNTYTSVAQSKNDPHSTFVRETLQFEEHMKTMKFNTCSICHQRRLNLTLKNEMCKRCENQRGNYTFSHANKALPTWMNKNQVMFTLPKELQELTLAEKLLIQKVSPLVPVVHIKNGTIGYKGHVVSFYQDITNICQTLPRLPSDVSIVKVIRSRTTSMGENISNSFNINKYRVMVALRWLKKFNPLYNDQKIYHG